MEAKETSCSPRATLGDPQNPPGEVMSKNKAKKLLKQQRLSDRRAASKAKAKQDKLTESKQRLAELQARLERMSQEERDSWHANRQVVRQDRKERNLQKKSRLQQAQAEGQQIVVDLGFDNLMTESEGKSLAHQLIYCYSVNSNSTVPCQLIFTDFQGAIAKQLSAQSPYHSQWLVTKHERPYIDVFRDRKDALVYLTADAAEELQELDPGKVYIIGGLVDRNRYKNICLDKAAQQGIKTARLPIREHLRMTGTHVLTINQVLALLLEVQQCHDWQQALPRVIPERKLAIDAQASAADCKTAAGDLDTSNPGVVPAAECGNQGEPSQKRSKTS